MAADPAWRGLHQGKGHHGTTTDYLLSSGKWTRDLAMASDSLSTQPHDKSLVCRN